MSIITTYLPDENDFLRIFLHNNFRLNKIFCTWSTLVAHHIHLESFKDKILVFRNSFQDY